MGLFNKKELTRIAELEAVLEDLGALDYVQIQQKKDVVQKQYDELVALISKSMVEVSRNKDLLDEIMLDIDMSDFGLYTPKYSCMTSEEYAEKIKENRSMQKEMIKNKKALNFSDNWSLDGNKAKGRAMNNDNMKMFLRAFNNECDVLISKVKFNNFDKIVEHIHKSESAINKLNDRNKISLRKEFVNLKIKELELVHEHAVKKQDEKEANRAAREEERENQKLIKEIEAARVKINKEKTHYDKAKKQILEQMGSADEQMKIELEAKLFDIDKTLCEIDKNLADVDYREANSKAGYVYVISNIGSFGEGVYKIGMTRRLEPQDRVDELGDASVPFRFDVHAMVFSDNAPKLENALHIAFENKKVNVINGRKEFFKVSLEEIASVIRTNHDKSIEFKMVADADQYREGLKMKL